ncbi:hypothetical protein TELCIR_20628, partial [Teladorsagia circumcincta]
MARQSYEAPPSYDPAPKRRVSRRGADNCEIQNAIFAAPRFKEAATLGSVKRSLPPGQHRAKIQLKHMSQLIHLGITSNDPKVTQAAALALIQFKALLRISEAQNLRSSHVKHIGNGLWQVKINKSKKDQFSKGAVIPFRFSAEEAQLWSKYINSV